MKTRNKSSPPVRGLRARQHGEAVALLSVYTDPVLAARVRTQAFNRGCTISQLVSSVLAESLGRSGGGGEAA